MIKKSFFGLISIPILIGICLSVQAQDNYEYQYYFKNYHFETVDFRMKEETKISLEPGDYLIYGSDEPAEQLTVLDTGLTYVVRQGRGNVFFWMPGEKRIGCEINADEFLEKNTKTVFTLENISGREVEYRLNGKRERLGNNEAFEYTFEGYFIPKIYLFSSGKTYALPSGKHLLWWIDSEKRVGLDINY